MTLYAKVATSGREANPDEKLDALCDIFEIEGLHELHPNTAELLKRRLLTLGSDELLDILMTVEYSKALYAARTRATAEGGPPRLLNVPSGFIMVDRDLFLTEDRSHVVPANNASARWLWASKGQLMPRVEAEQLGALAIMDS